METNGSENNQRIKIDIEETTFSIAPGKSTEIHFVLTNQGLAEDDFLISVIGIPTTWLSTATPQIKLLPSEHKEIILEIQPPESQQAGIYSFKVNVASKIEPSEREEFKGTLTIAAFQSKGRIGVLLGATQFSVQAGSSVKIGVILFNQGLEEDYFKLSLEGIPTSWTFTPVPVVNLSPGEQQEVEITIQPPRNFQSKAGRNPIKLIISSHKAPDQSVTANLTLTIGAFSQFNIQLQPDILETNQPGIVTINNLGNTNQTFQLTFSSQGDKLNFTPDTTREFKIPPGQSIETEITSAPKINPLLGGEHSYPFEVQVKSSDKETQIDTGVVTSNGIIPIWVLPIFISVCMALLCLLSFYLTQNIQQSQMTKTSEALMTDAVMPTDNVGIIPTEAPPEATPDIQTPIPPTETMIPPTLPPTDIPTQQPTQIPTDEPTIVPTGSVPPIQGLGKIVFVSNRMADLEIFTLNTDDFSVSQVTVDPGNDTEPVWSPDGKRIAFASNRNGNFDIYIMNEDGTSVNNLTNNPADDRHPTWSTDGEWIAFTTNRDGNQEIYKIKIDGSEVINLTNSLSEDYQPDWFQEKGVILSQDEWIAFTSNRDGNQEIYIMKSDGSEPLNLTNNLADDFQPSGSPQGGRIAFSSNRDGNQEIYLMFLDGSEQLNITNSLAEDYEPTWAPDGNWLCFTTNRDGNLELYISRVDGTEQWNLTNNPAEDTSPSWR